MPSPAAAAALRAPLTRLPRLTPRTLLAAGLIVAGLAGGWMWLRDSQLVAVDKVVVSGTSGSQAAQIRAALQAAGADMTTLHVRTDDLRAAVAMYPIVRDVRVQRDLPHGLRITVLQHVPVAAVQAGGRRTSVAADGTVLRGADADRLPVVVARTAPGDGRLEPRTARAVALLAAAPAALRARVERVAAGSRGWTATLRDGPMLVFGVAQRLRAKWIAVARVLADRSSAGATYLDVRLPERPAAGGLVDPVDQAKADAPPQAIKQGTPAPAAGPTQTPAASPQPAPTATPPAASTPQPEAAGAGVPQE